jgi:hypothetical protein
MKFHEGKVPLWFKVIGTLLCGATLLFNAINYTLVDLLWFCDVAMVLVIIGLWRESSLLLSLATLASIGPQFAWQLDYFYQLISNKPLFGFTDYMFADSYPTVNYIVSLFHVWMPAILIYGLYFVGYDRRAFKIQSICSLIIILLSYSLTADMFGPAGNLNQVYGPSAIAPQTWMRPWLWLFVIWLYTIAVIYVPTHLITARVFPLNRKNPN